MANAPPAGSEPSVLLQILTDITEGQGRNARPEELHDHERKPGRPFQLRSWTNCRNPIRDILNHFRAEVEAHIRLKVCPTGICPMHPREKRTQRVKLQLA